MIESREAINAWKKALRYIIENGQKYVDHRGRECFEVENLNIKLTSVQGIDKPILILRKFDEWEFPPLEEIEDIVLLRKEIPRYVYSYGSRIFNFATRINQIDDYVVPLLQKDPHSRRATICFLDVVCDLKVDAKDMPSLISISFLIRNGKLNVTAYIRSNDFFFGWPANIYQIFIIQQYVAKILNCELGNLTSVSVSAHIYSDQLKYIEKLLK